MATPKTSQINEEKLRKVFDSLFQVKANNEMQMLHRIWFRNVLYYLGEQWFEWVRGQNTFRRIMPNPQTPTPVSNMIRDYVRSMKSLIINKEYTVTIWPNSNDQEDREAAEMGEQLLRWLETWDDERYQDEREKVAIWTIITGNAFDRTYLSTEDDGWSFDASGNPITKGNCVTESVSPFALMLDTFGDTFRKKRHIGIKSLRPREWVEDTWKVKLTADAASNEIIDYERKLSKLVANVSPWKGDGMDQMTELADEDLVLFKEVEVRPTRDNPSGIYAAMVNDQFIFKYARLPIPVGEDGRWEYSITDYHYHYVPGRYWSDGGVNDLISPQNSVNEIDQDLAVNRKGIGRPIVLVATDVNMKRLTHLGQSVTVMQYDGLLSGGIAPEISSGKPLPQQVLEERAIHMQVTQDAAGDPKNVLRGKAPSSNPSGVMVDILRDAAEQGHLPDVNRFFRGVKRSKRKQLLVVQEAYTEKRLIKIPDRGGRPSVISFKGSNLRNNTDIRIELSSGVSSTKAGQAQMLIKLTETGFFNADNPLDPEYRIELLRKMGLSGFKDKQGADTQRAVDENERVANMRDEKDLPVWQGEIPNPDDPEGVGELVEIPIIPGLFLAIGDGAGDGIVISDDPLFKYDNHAIHYETHRRFILDRAFRFLPEDSQQAMLVHMDYHKWTMDMEAQKQQDQLMQRAAEFEAQSAAAKGAIGAEPGAPAGGGDMGGGGGLPSDAMPAQFAGQDLELADGEPGLPGSTPPGGGGAGEAME
jgi:hypothetical protein